MESHVHRNNSKIAVIKLSQGTSSHCIAQNLKHEFLQPPPFWNGIESSTNGRSCYHHDICGSLVEEDVVLRLRKMQIRRTALDRKRLQSLHFTYLMALTSVMLLGFLRCHFVPHAPSFDGVLVQVTEVYSPTSESVSKRKKFCHNMGCCLTTLITELPAWAAQANKKSTSAFLTKLEKQEGEGEDDDDHTTNGRAAVGFVGYEDNDCRPVTVIATARATATATRPFAEQRRSEHAAAARPKKCTTPTATTNKVAAKKKTSRDSTPSRRSNRVLDLDRKSRSTKMKPHVLDLTASVSPKKKSPCRKLNQKVMTAPPVAAATTVARKRKTTPKKFTAVDREKTRLEDMEVRYMKDGVRKLYVNFSDDSNDSAYKDSND